MTRNIWIGIIVVVALVTGGWWYLNNFQMTGGSPSLNFVAKTESGTVPLMVTFSANIPNDSYSYTVYFGDETQVDVTCYEYGSDINKCSPFTTQHTYKNIGTFSASVRRVGNGSVQPETLAKITITVTDNKDITILGTSLLTFIEPTNKPQKFPVLSARWETRPAIITKFSRCGVISFDLIPENKNLPVISDFVSNVGLGTESFSTGQFGDFVTAGKIVAGNRYKLHASLKSQNCPESLSSEVAKYSSESEWFLVDNITTNPSQ